MDLLFFGLFFGWHSSDFHVYVSIYLVLFSRQFFTSSCHPSMRRHYKRDELEEPISTKNGRFFKLTYAWRDKEKYGEKYYIKNTETLIHRRIFYIQDTCNINISFIFHWLFICWSNILDKKFL